MIFFDFFLHRTEAPFSKGEMRMDILRDILRDMQTTQRKLAQRMGVQVK